MRSFVPGYELIAPADLSQVVTMLDEEPGEWRPMAGGTDLMVLFEAGKLPWRRFLGLWKLKELRGIDASADAVTIGALTTYADVLKSEILQGEFPLLTLAAAETGGIATQNRGTLGGNIVNASPAADTPPALLVYDAEVELTSLKGSAWFPYRDFHTGYKQMRLRPNEILTRVRLPRTTADWIPYFRKVGTRKAQAISKICCAGLRHRQTGEVRVAFGSVAPTPLRCFLTEAAVREGRDAADVLATEISPIDDIRSTSAYRLRVAQNLLRELIHAS